MAQTEEPIKSVLKIENWTPPKRKLRKVTAEPLKNLISNGNELRTFFKGHQLENYATPRLGCVLSLAAW